MYTYKIMLCPNNKQATRLKQTMNKCIECQRIIFDIIDARMQKHEGLPKCTDLRREFTKLKKELDQKMLNSRINMTHQEMRDNHLDVLFSDVSNDALKQTIKDTYNSFVRFLKHLAKYPIKKEYSNKFKGFYVDPYKIRFSNTHVKLEKIATSLKENRQVLNLVKLAEKKRIPQDCKYYNPRVTFDGNRFWLTVGVDDEFRPIKSKKTSSETIGIDLNISTINLSNGKEYVTVNKEIKIKKATKRLKRVSRSNSRQYLTAKENKRKLRNSYNFIKTKRKIRNLYRRLKNMRSAYNDDIINDIFKVPPKKIVIETLDVKSMSQNKKISSKLQITGFRLFINKLKDRVLKYATVLIEADKYYPSSKKCSNCGNIKEKLKLSDRIYKCDCCKCVIKRDLHAAINLANYK